MAKKVTNKKTAPKKVAKQPVFKRPNINLLVTMTVLVLSLFFVLYQANQSQNLRTKAAGDCSVTSVQLQTSSLEQDLFNRINQYRAGKGLDPLTWDQSLNQEASWMTRDMITRGSVQKIDSLGRSMDIRFGDCGVRNTNNYNEIIINGAPAADEILAGLQIDPPDNAILTNASYTIGAISVETDSSGQSAYWTIAVAGNANSSLTPILSGSSNPGVTSGVPSPQCLGSVCPTAVATQAPDNFPVTPTPTSVLAPTVFLTQAPTPTDVPGGDGPGTGGGTPSPGLSGTIDPNDPNPGGGTISTTPGDPNDPNNPGNPDDPDNGGGLPPIDGEGGFIGFLLALFALLLRFFLSMFGR